MRHCRFTTVPLGRHGKSIRLNGDLNLNIFGEIFWVSPELQLEYVVATINVKEQKLKLFLDKTQVNEFRYKLH
jgi:putative transposase